MEDEDDVPEDSEDDESSEEGMDLETDDEYEVRLHGDCCDLLDGTSIAHESQHNPSPVGMRYRRTMSVDRACSVTSLEREIFGSQSDTSSESHSPIEDSRGRRKTSPGSEGRARSTPPLPHNTVSFVLVPPPVLPHLQTDFTHLTDTRVIYDYLAKDHDIQLDVSRAEADDGEVTDDDLPPLIPVASTPPTLEEVNTFLTAVSLMHGANTEYVNEVTHGLRDPTTYGSSFAQETEQASGMTENLSHSNIEVEPPHVVRRREREYLLRELCEDVTDSSEQSNSDNSDDDAPMALELPYTHDLDITAVPYPLITASSPPPSPLGSYVSDNVPTPGCDSMFVQTCTPLDTLFHQASPFPASHQPTTVEAGPPYPHVAYNFASSHDRWTNGEAIWKTTGRTGFDLAIPQAGLLSTGSPSPIHEAQALRALTLPSTDDLERQLEETGHAPGDQFAAVLATRRALLQEARPFYNHALRSGLIKWIDDMRRLPAVPDTGLMMWKLRMFFPKSTSEGCPFLDPLEEIDIFQALQFFEAKPDFYDADAVRTLTRILALRTTAAERKFISGLLTRGYLGSHWTLPRLSSMPRSSKFATERV